MMARFRTLVSLGAMLWVLAGAFVCCQAQNNESTWQDRLEASINGKLPNELPEGFEQIYWYNLRANVLATEQLEMSLRYAGKPLFKNLVVQELCRAIVEGDIKNMETLIKQGVDINSEGVGGITPLLVAFFNDKDPRP